MLERKGEVRTKVLPNARKATVRAEVRARVEPGSAVHTDAPAGYRGPTPDYVHEAADRAAEHVRGSAHTNGSGNRWSLLGRGIRGTCVGVEPSHLFRGLDEENVRHNERERADGTVEADGGRFGDVTGTMGGKRSTYAGLTGKTPGRPPEVQP